MTAPPLPASPCVRVRLDYTQEDNNFGGNRFFLSYSGASPTSGNCVTLADDVQSAWAAHIAPLVDPLFSLTEVDVLDIASVAGASGQWTGDTAGSRSGTSLPAQCATNIEYKIARRYRGGKPRIFLPPGVNGDQQTNGTWTTAFVDECDTAFLAFMVELEALSIGAIGTLAHVNLSYYDGFKNVTNSSGRTRAAPTYRDTALVDTVTGYVTKTVIGSQKRRRTATTY